MPDRALTSAEISLPVHPDTARVTERIAQLARDVELVVLTDNHAGQPRMSPLAAVALAREQGVRTVVHISARDRNRLALQSEVVGAAALGCDGIVCLHGDDVPGIARVGDMTGTQLLAAAGEWLAPLPVARGCVLNPFATDPDRELRLLRRKLECGATFAHTQMCFNIPTLTGFMDRAGEAGLLQRLRVYVTVGVLRSRAMADRARSLPGCDLPDAAYAQVCAGGGRELALEMAQALADLPVVDALHVMPLGDEPTAAQAAASFRRARSAQGMGSRAFDHAVSRGGISALDGVSVVAVADPNEGTQPIVPIAGDETATLLGALERERAIFAWKCGVGVAGLRATLGPSTITLGGLLKHLALVEDEYFSHRLHGRPLGHPWNTVDWDADENWEWHSAASDSPEQLVTLWQDAVVRSRSAVTEALARDGLGQLVSYTTSTGESPNLRRVLVDVIEEYGRHNGHADLIRESVDGLVGEDPPVG